jgi:hypothetical protein
MGFRFRRRIKLLPGLWFNLSKTGVSTSVGTKGLKVNFKDGKTRTTISAPGTGLSYSTTSTTKPPITMASTRSVLDGSNPPRPTVRPMIWIALTVAVCVTIYMLKM